MEDQREKNGQWLSIPQFGDWDQKGGMPDYSMDFTEIREMKKQNKRDPSRASLGNEDELVNPTHQLDNKKQTDKHQPLHHTPTEINKYNKFLDKIDDGDAAHKNKVNIAGIESGFH